MRSSVNIPKRTSFSAMASIAPDSEPAKDGDDCTTGIVTLDSSNSTDKAKQAWAEEAAGKDEGPTIIKFDRRRDGPLLGFIVCISLASLLLMSIWSPIERRHDIHSVHMHTFSAVLTSPLYAVSADKSLTIELKENPRDAFEIKMAVPCSLVDCGGGSHRRRRRSRHLLTSDVLKDVVHGSQEYTNTTVHFELYYTTASESKMYYSSELEMAEDEEAELLKELDLHEYNIPSDSDLSVYIYTDSVDPVALMFQVVQFNSIGANRFPICAVLFITTFILIVSEVIHRVYATILGSLLGLLLLSVTHDVPGIAHVANMIDFGTLMLLFSMMISVHLLSNTGVFQWTAIQIAAYADGNLRLLFFLMANIVGVLSAFLNNVTVVMLVGPVTIRLCQQLKVDPVPFYLAQTISTTIGGTATLIGDPPNVVIGNKLELPFNDFLYYNGPLVIFILPMGTVVLYFFFKDKIPHKVELNLEKLQRDNKITDERALSYVGTLTVMVMFVGLFMSPVHGREPSWFCLLAMFYSCLAVSHHNIRDLLKIVEWDTLLFFGCLFVFVESLAELGFIREIGQALTDIIKSVPQDSRLGVALLLVLWVSAIGSAFLESLPYTTTITYILLDMRNNQADELGIDVNKLAWALSVGACVGGIGSIMGSSANLVAMSVSERYSPDQKIIGSDFLRYGFPTLVVTVLFSSLYQYIIFVGIGL